MKLPGIKRILPLILTVLLLPAPLAVPAMAEENQFWYELLDYGVSQYGSNHISLDPVTSATRKYIRYENPIGSVQSYFDITFRTDDTSPRIVSSSTWLQVVNVSGDVWRAFGSSGIIGAYFYLEYDDGTYVDILSFKATPVSFDSVETPVVGELFNYGDLYPDLSYPFSYHADGEAHSVSFTAESEFDNTFLSEMVLADWKKFDYVDLHMAVWGQSINSISAYLTDGSQLPVSSSVILSGTQQNTNLYVVSVRVDLTEVLRSNNHSLVVCVAGSLFKGESGSFTIYRASGIILPVTDNIFVYWFSQLKGWLSSGFDRVVSALGGSNDASGVQDEINSAVGELQQAGAAIDSVERPDIGHIDIDVVGMVDPAGLSGVASIVGLFTGNELIYTIMLMFLTLALISYILYGSR